MSSTSEGNLGLLWPRHAPSVQLPNLRRTTIWKSVSHDCLPQLAHSRRNQDQVEVRTRHAAHWAPSPSESVNQSSSNNFTSLYSRPPGRSHFVSKLDQRTLQINDTASPSPSSYSGLGRRLSCNSTNPYQCIREPSLPSYVVSTTSSLQIARERDRAVRFSETNLPNSLTTLDSFMDIESINDEPLETDYSPSTSFAQPHPSHSSTSTKALWKSLATNASTLISVFEPRTTKRASSLEQQSSSLPSSPQNKGRAIFNLKLNPVRNHKKSFFLPPGQLEPEPRLLSQPISRIPGKLPALHKRVSAIFRGGPSNRNQIHYSESDDTVGTNQEPSPGIAPDPLAYFVTPTLQTHLNPSGSSAIPNYLFRSENGGIITERSNLAESSSMLTSSSLLKNKPLPDIPVEQATSDIYDETESDDKMTTSSCLGSMIDCFTMLNAQWPEPPRHMMFLDPGMTEMLSYTRHKGLELDISLTPKKSPLIAICTQDLKESLNKLLASIEIYLNGSQISSQPPLPSTLVFPITTATGSSRLNDTIQLTIRAPTRSLLMSFCTVYADTTLTFEEQTYPLNQLQVEISIRSAVFSNQPNYEELNIAVPDKNARRKELTTYSESEDAALSRILVELPCTLGELAMVITNASVM